MTSPVKLCLKQAVVVFLVPDYVGHFQMNLCGSHYANFAITHIANSELAASLAHCEVLPS